MCENPFNNRKAAKSIKRQRKPKVKLPPVLAREMDIIRAATMGFDISHMAPDERCKYPSKFCCNMRARKSTGKLHRLCELHRSRAKINQQRWVELRRQQAHSEEMAKAATVLERDVLVNERDWASLVEAETNAAGSTLLPPRDEAVSLFAPDTTPTTTSISDRELDALIADLLRGEQVYRNDAWAVLTPST